MINKQQDIANIRNEKYIDSVLKSDTNNKLENIKTNGLLPCFQVQ